MGLSQQITAALVVRTSAKETRFLSPPETPRTNWLPTMTELVSWCKNRNNRDRFDLPLVFLVWGIPKVSNIRDKRPSAYSARFSLSSFLRGSFKYRAALIVSSTVSRGWCSSSSELKIIWPSKYLGSDH